MNGVEILNNLFLIHNDCFILFSMQFPFIFRIKKTYIVFSIQQIVTFFKDCAIVYASELCFTMKVS